MFLYDWLRLSLRQNCSEEELEAKSKIHPYLRETSGQRESRNLRKHLYHKEVGEPDRIYKHRRLSQRVKNIRKTFDWKPFGLILVHQT